MKENLKPSNSRCARRFGAVVALLFAVACAGRARSARAAEETKNASAGRATAQQPKEDLRYAGRTFDDWRQQLLNDLDPKTCAAAMEPIAAFGKMGYADEAVAALVALLRADRAAAQDGNLAMQATGTLARIGPAAVPALTEGLADPRPAIRRWCAFALGELGGDADSAKEPLEKLLRDERAEVQRAALRSLVQVAGDDEDLRLAFKSISESNDEQTRITFAYALSNYPPKGDWWVPLFLRLADDENSDVRQAVGTLLAHRGPPRREVIAAVEQLICDDNGQVSMQTAASIAQEGNTALLVAVLADAIESNTLWNHFRGQGHLPSALATLSNASDSATSSVPLLARIVEMKVPNCAPNEVVAAMDALGKLGPAAQDAVPALELYTARADLDDDDLYRKHARRALKKIRGH